MTFYLTSRNRHKLKKEDYGNILQLALELMDLLQASIRGQPVTIGNDIFERLSARLGTRR